MWCRDQGADGCLQTPPRGTQDPSVQLLAAVSTRAWLCPPLVSLNQKFPVLGFSRAPGQAKWSGQPAWGAAWARGRCAGLLPSFLGPDGPVETDHLVASLGQVTQGVVCVLRKDDLGKEETGSNWVRPLSNSWSAGCQEQTHCYIGDRYLELSPCTGTGGVVKGWVQPFALVPSLFLSPPSPGHALTPRTPQAVLTYHGYQWQRLCFQLALHSPSDVSDVRQGKLLKLLWAQVPRVRLEQLERLADTRSWESCGHHAVPWSLLLPEARPPLLPVRSPCPPAWTCPHAQDIPALQQPPAPPGSR